MLFCSSFLKHISLLMWYYFVLAQIYTIHNISWFNTYRLLLLNLFNFRVLSFCSRCLFLFLHFSHMCYVFHLCIRTMVTRSLRHIADLDCKLKSATQTPAAMHNNLHNNVPEILGRSNVNNSQMYYKTVSTHFASCIIILIFKIVSDSGRLWIPCAIHSENFLCVKRSLPLFVRMMPLVLFSLLLMSSALEPRINVTVDIIRSI